MNKLDTLIPGRFREIPVTLSIPDGEGPFPFVVMLHGTYSCRHEMFGGYDLLAEELVKNKIAGLQFDFAGCGDSKADYIDYSMAGALADCSDVIKWSIKQEQIDPERMGIIGWSQGGQLAIMKAAEEPRTKSLVLWAPTLSMKSFWPEEKKTALSNGFVHFIPGFRPPLDVSKAWFDEADYNNASLCLPEYSGAILAIAGTEDEYKLYEGIPAIMDSCAGSNKDSMVVEGANHIFNIDASERGFFPQVLKKTVSRFAETL